MANMFRGKNPTYRELHGWLEDGRREMRWHWHTRLWKVFWRALNNWFSGKYHRVAPKPLPLRLAQPASDRRRGVQNTEQLAAEVRRLSRKFERRPTTTARDPVPRLKYRKGGRGSVVLDKKELAPPPPDPCRFHQLDRKDRWSVTTYRYGPGVSGLTCSGIMLPHAHVHVFGGPDDRAQHSRWEKKGWKKFDELEESTWDAWEDPTWETQDQVTTLTGTEYVFDCVPLDEIENRDSKETGSTGAR